MDNGAWNMKHFWDYIQDGFITFERINGWLVYIPWGCGFIWYGTPSAEVLMQYSVWHERFAFNYAMCSVGLVLIIWGLRKGTVNRAKQQVMVEERARRIRKKLEKQGKL